MSQNHADRFAIPGRSSRRRDQPSSAALKQRRRLPVYRLILFPDPAGDLMFVVRTVMELTRLCREEATYKMWEAHHAGRSRLLTTYKERAEWFVEQFANRGLTVMIEPA